MTSITPLAREYKLGDLHREFTPNAATLAEREEHRRALGLDAEDEDMSGNRAWQATMQLRRTALVCFKRDQLRPERDRVRPSMDRVPIRPPGEWWQHGVRNELLAQVFGVEAVYLLRRRDAIIDDFESGGLSRAANHGPPIHDVPWGAGLTLRQRSARASAGPRRGIPPRPGQRRVG